MAFHLQIWHKNGLYPLVTVSSQAAVRIRKSGMAGDILTGKWIKAQSPFSS